MDGEAALALVRAEASPALLAPDLYNKGMYVNVYKFLSVCVCVHMYTVKKALKYN
jgi:hypothetical protein